MNLSKLRLITKICNSLFTGLKTLIGIILELRPKGGNGTYKKLRKLILTLGGQRTNLEKLWRRLLLKTNIKRKCLMI